MILIRVLAVALGHIKRRPGLALATLLVALVSAAGLTYIVGDSTAQSTQLLQQLRTPTARSILIRAATSDTTLDVKAANAIGNLPGVEYAVGLTAVKSATNTAIPGTDDNLGYFDLTVIRGDAPYELTTGKQPGPGEAILADAGAARVHAEIPLASSITVNDTVVGIVGTYTTPDHGQISQLLATSALTLATPDVDGYALIALTVKQPSDLAVVVRTLPILLSDLLPTDYSTEYDPRLDNVEATVAAATRKNTRQVALGLTALGAAIEALITAVNALTQRREIARRRALGATRTTILSTLIVESAILGILGAAIGSATASIILGARYDTAISVALPAAAAIFVATISVIAAIPGGLFGAYQDPATVLRVP